MRETALEISGQAESLRKGYQQEGIIPEKFGLPYVPWDDFKLDLENHNPLALGPVRAGSEPGLGRLFSANQLFGGELKTFISHIAGVIQADGIPVIVSRQAPRLQEIWKERAAYPETPVFIKGSIEGGWVMTPDVGKELHIFSDGEIFGWRRIQPRRKPVHRALSPEVDYSDFKDGDWVVHLDHGIGRYGGLVSRQLAGVEGEYLAVEYADGDQLYVPAPQADRLTRYVGPDHHDPKITRLGSNRWGLTKSRVKEEVIEVAQDLLELYSKRETVQGYAFSPDTAWQQELEASFPYLETEDQLHVLSTACINSSQKGYGKTETDGPVNLR